MIGPKDGSWCHLTAEVSTNKSSFPGTLYCYYRHSRTVNTNGSHCCAGECDDVYCILSSNK